MAQILLVGLGAGAAGALMFAAIASGSLLSLALFYLAPTPILIAALGWSHLAGLAAALVGAAALFAAFNLAFAVAFLAGVGLPAWWLGYLALLARPVAANGAEQVEWYPAGRLVFWAALLGGLIVTAAIPQFGDDAESVRATLKSGFERVFRLQTGASADAPLTLPGVSDPNLLFELLARAIPPAAAMLTTAALLANLWAAGRAVSVSGRLRRPWPDLAALTLPPYAALSFAAAIACSFLPDLIGLVGGLFAAAFAIAYAALGLAVLHALSARLKGRAFVLTGVYAAILVFGWPLVAIMLLGLVDAMLDLRRRAALKRGPPPGPPV